MQTELRATFDEGRDGEFVININIFLPTWIKFDREHVEWRKLRN